MADPTTEDDFQMTAFTEQIFRSVVLFYSVPNDKELVVGSGVLLSYKGQKYLVSAFHNFGLDDQGLPEVVHAWNAARFKLTDGKPLSFEDNSKIPAHRMSIDRGIPLTVSDPDQVKIDKPHDLVAVRLSATGKQYDAVHFVDLDTEAFNGELQKDMDLVIVGNPFSGVVPISNGQKALVAHLDHVLYDPTIDTSRVASRYLSPDYMFMPFSLHKESVLPAGFSGAGVFTHVPPPDDGVWVAGSRVVGVVLRHFERQQMLLVVRTETIIKFLQETSQ